MEAEETINFITIFYVSSELQPERYTHNTQFVEEMTGVQGILMILTICVQVFWDSLS